MKKVKHYVITSRKRAPKQRQFGSRSSATSSDSSETSDDSSDSDVSTSDVISRKNNRLLTLQTNNGQTRVRGGVIVKTKAKTMNDERHRVTSSKPSQSQTNRHPAAAANVRNSYQRASVIWKNLQSTSQPKIIQPSFNLTFNSDMESFMPFVTSQVSDEMLFISPWQRHIPGVRYPRHSAASIVIGT